MPKRDDNKQYIKISELKPYENNARTHSIEQIEAICNSIKEFGFINPVIIDENNMILVGHGRIEAAKVLGIDEAPYRRVTNLTEDQKRAYILADNKLSDLGGWDEDLLAQELGEIELDMSLFGFDNIELEEMDFETEDIIEDEAPEINDEEEPKAKRGDIYKLGNHFLMCGDSTSESDVKKLLSFNGGAPVDMIFTDPPYNVAFNGRSGKFEVIENDNLTSEQFESFILSVVKIIKQINPRNYYVWCNWKFYGVLQKALDFKACIVWAKNVFGLGKGYRHQHEFCLFNGEIDEEIKNESDLWQIAKDTNYIHPTQKPVALCARALKNHKTAKTIVDLFGGSGSTLIACEQLKRACYCMELDPQYMDVIIQRWENFTGKKAELVKEA